MEHNASWPVSVVEVDVQGSGLNDYTIRKSIQPLLEPTTLGGLLEDMETSARRLRAFNVHESVSYTVDTADESQLNLPERYDISDPDTLLLKAKLRLSALPRFSPVGTQIASSLEDGALTLSYGLRDFMGFGDVWTGAVHWINNPFQRGKNMSVLADFPVFASPFRRLQVAASRQNFDTTDSKLNEQKNGLSFSFAQLCHCNTIAKLSLDVEERSLSSLDGEKSSSSDSQRVAISANWQMDTRSKTSFPSKGHYVNFSLQGAGPLVRLPGDASYVRATFDSNFGRDLLRGWINLNVTARAGYMSLLSGTVSDKFFLGSALPGFQYNGIGPRNESKVALGGDSFTFGNASIFAKIPYLANTALRSHFYISGASLLSGVMPDAMIERPSAASAGLGLSYRSSNAQIEVSYAVPFKAGSTDVVRPGIRLGVSLAL